MKTFALLAAMASLTASLSAADWPQWRGPERNDHSPDASTLVPWPEGGPKRLWVFKDAGLGYSGFSIVGTTLYTMGARGGKEEAIALDAATGKKLWTAEVGDSVYENNWGDGPRSTPTVDGDHLFALSARGVLACLKTADGSLVWKTDLVADLGGELQGWGYTESVLVDGDKVICTPGGPNGTMAALDKATGKVLWRSTDVKDAAQYSSPILIQHGGKPQIAQLLMKKIIGIDPADGKLLWKANFPGSVAVIPTLLHQGDHIYATAGYKAGCVLIKLTGGAEPEYVYEEQAISDHHGGVILADGKVYGHSDKGGWTCQDFLTGEIHWQSDALGKGACTWVAGHLVAISEKDGEVALIEAKPDAWKEVSRFKLSPQSDKRKRSGAIWTHPVVLDGRLYLRDQELVHCYDVKGN